MGMCVFHSERSVLESYKVQRPYRSDLDFRFEANPRGGEGVVFNDLLAGHAVPVLEAITWMHVLRREDGPQFTLP